MLNRMYKKLSNRMYKKLSNQKGFTLIELLVIVAIIGILATIIVPSTFRAIENSKVIMAVADYKAVKSGVLHHYADTGSWPEDAIDGKDPNLMENNDRVGPDWDLNNELRFNYWNGPYLARWKPEHPWGGYYEYGNTMLVCTEEGKEEAGISRDIFRANEVVSLKLRSLGNRVDEVYNRLKNELGENRVEKDVDTKTVHLAIITK